MSACGVFLPLPLALAARFPARGSDDFSTPHVTLLYVGETERLDDLVDLARAVAAGFDPFDVALRDYDEFVNREGQTIAHMAPRAAELAGLHEALASAARRIGFEVERRPFRPHATLAYVASGDAYRGPRPTGSWRADGLEVWGHGRRVAVPFGERRPSGALTTLMRSQRDHDPLEGLQTQLALAVADAQGELADALADLARAHADPLKRAGREAVVARVASLIARVKAAGELAARVATRFPSAAAPPPDRFASFRLEGPRIGVPPLLEVEGTSATDPVPRVAFDEAVASLAERDPVGAHDLERIGLAVADLYAPSPGAPGALAFPSAFAAAKAADADMARRTQAMLVEGLAGGAPTPRVVERLVAAWDWPAAYSETVVRTNYNAASSAGRFRQAERVEQTTGLRCGFRFMAVDDSDVRRGRAKDHGENHLALDGLVARQDDPIWERFTPPGGYACRCSIVVVMGDEVPEGFVAVPSGAAFAPGFGRKPR